MPLSFSKHCVNCTHMQAHTHTHTLTHKQTHTHTHKHKLLIWCMSHELKLELNFLTLVDMVVCMSTVLANCKSFSAIWQHQPTIGNRSVDGQSGRIFIVKLDVVRFVKTNGRGYSSQESMLILAGDFWYKQFTTALSTCSTNRIITKTK